MSAEPGANANANAEARAATLLAGVVISVLAILVVPLPPPILDGLLAVNLAASIVVLLLSLRIKEALDLSIFPSLLLVLTLLRLALNVATTRLILLHGGEEHSCDGGHHIVLDSHPAGPAYFCEWRQLVKVFQQILHGRTTSAYFFEIK